MDDIEQAHQNQTVNIENLIIFPNPTVENYRTQI
jgi:hypothetical protein